MSAEAPEQEESNAMDLLVSRHAVELRHLVADEQISALDHDMIGFAMGRIGGYLLFLSDGGWDTFVRFINESRKVVNEKSKTT